MKKNILKVKDTLTIQDRVNVIETIAGVFFRTNEDNGTVEYTPYFKEIGQVTAVAKFIIEGLEFEDKEDIHKSVVSDGKVLALVREVMKEKYFNEIMDEVKDIVEYRKKERIARIQNEANSIITYKILELIEKEQEKTQKEIEANDNLNAWIEKQRKQQEELNKVIPIEKQKEFFDNFELNDIVKSIYEQISESDMHKRNKEIIELSRKTREQENKIVELQTAFANEQKKNDVRNVLADKK